MSNKPEMNVGPISPSHDTHGRVSHLINSKLPVLSLRRNIFSNPVKMNKMRENRKGQRTIISRCKQISQVAKLDNLLSTGDIKNNKDKGAKEVNFDIKNDDIDFILRKHGGFDMPMPGITSFNRMMSTDLDDKESHKGKNSKKHKALWMEVLKYVHEKQYDGLVTKIIIEDK